MTETKLFQTNAITKLFGIQYPIILGGMIWSGGWKLASAVSNAGGLGLIGAGSMYPEVLREHLLKCKAATDKPFGVNLPMLYANVQEHLQIIKELGVKIVFTSAGNPKTWTKQLQDLGIIVAHVTANVKFALKAAEAGVNAVVCEGFEAGGHNGKEEITTFCLVPQVRKAVDIPLIAAGGIATGGGLLAALALGADAVQIGSRFAATTEASCHPNFKKNIIDAKDDATILALKKLNPVRLLKNEFCHKILELENQGAKTEELAEALGRGRAKKGMFEGDLIEGELEIGQIAGLIDQILPANKVIEDIISEYSALKKAICSDAERF